MIKFYDWLMDDLHKSKPYNGMVIAIGVGAIAWLLGGIVGFESLRIAGMYVSLTLCVVVVVLLLVLPALLTPIVMLMEWRRQKQAIRNIERP